MPESNKIMDDFPPIPEWLDKSYMENVLKIYHKDKTTKILEMDIYPATGKGENYASVMFRAGIKYCGQSINGIQFEKFILKMSFENKNFITEKLAQLDIYTRELEIYDKIFPKLNLLLQKAGDYEEMYPKSIYVDYDHDLIIFEDLAERKFVLADRLKGLDIHHTKMVLRKLAKIHAASAVLSEHEPETFKHNYDHGMYNRYSEEFSPYFVNNLNIMGKLVKNWKNFETISEKLLKLVPNLMEKGKKVFDAKSDHLNALIHGDLWMNNVMFKYNGKGELEDALVVDFQYSAWTSPTVDLHYFLNTSLMEDVRLFNLDELVQFYYIILADTLRALEFKGKIPTLHEFWIQYIEKSFYAFTSACIVQPVVLNEIPDEANFSALLGEDESAFRFKKAVYENEKVQNNLRRLLPVFDRQGLLDIY